MNLEIKYDNNKWHIIDLNTNKDLLDDNKVRSFTFKNDKTTNQPILILELLPENIFAKAQTTVKCKRAKLK